MLTLKSVRDILEFMGLVLEQDATWLLHYKKNVIITIPLFALLCPLCAYFVYNFSNLVNATDVFYVIAATLLCIVQYWFLAIQKRPLERLLSELQTLVDRRECDLIFLPFS